MKELAYQVHVALINDSDCNEELSPRDRSPSDFNRACLAVMLRVQSLTRSRRENPAFNYGETPSITIAFGEDYFHAGEHVSKYECRRRGEQGKTPRSAFR